VAAEKGRLGTVGRHASERERVAMEAERDSVRIKQIAYMETQLGETFAGIISGVRAFGLFVKLDKILVEGLIPIGALGDDFYRVDEEHYVAHGRTSGRTFRLGDAVTVQVVRVDPVSKQVDFRLLAGGTEKARAGGRKAEAKPSERRPDARKPGARKKGRRKR
jgi:ribonuclease R